MPGLIALTQIAFPILLGLLIGGAIAGESGAVVAAAVLMAADIILGCTLQYFYERGTAKAAAREAMAEAFADELAAQYEENRRADAEASSEDLGGKDPTERSDSGHSSYAKGGEAQSQLEDDDEVDRFTKNMVARMVLRAIHRRLMAQGGSKSLNGILSDESGKFLLSLCQDMEHAPPSYTLSRATGVIACDLDEREALIFSFAHDPASYCQNAYIFVVLTKDNKVRFFAVETHAHSLYLCEYSGNSHINYGVVNTETMVGRVMEILDADNS